MMSRTLLFRSTIFLVAGLLSARLMAAEPLVVEINKGKRVTLPVAAASVVAANPAIADVQVVSPRVLYIYGRGVGETSVLAIDNADNTIYDSQVVVSHNLSSLARAVRRIAPDADVTFSSVNNGLVMEGFAASSVESENIRSVAANMLGDNQKLVNMITTGGSDQVTLQVKIVEMTRSNVKRFGINLQSAVTQGSLAVRLLQGANVTGTTYTPLFPPVSGVGFPARTGLSNATASTDTALFAGLTDGNKTIGAVIDMLENQGLANILAEPTLTTTSGKTANFLAGGEFPIPQKDGLGNVTVTYKPFGVKLDFTPVVMSKDRMSITVAPEVSTINFDNPIEVAGIKNPIINSRKAQATLELGSGETFALAGLLRTDETNNIDKTPAVGDLPILGALFRSQQFRNDKTELVILVTPYIVKAVSDKSKMLTPRDGYVPPSDLQRLLYGNLYQQEPMDDDDGEAAEPPPVDDNGKSPKLQGEGGFILE
jgi:pilus assembly protein CpaC